MSNTLPPPLPPHDLATVTALLGRDPGRGTTIVATNAQHQPAVLRCYPLRVPAIKPPEPFPTLSWLLDPDLHHRIADLERLGVIQEVHDLIARRHDLKDQLAQAHRNYAQHRWQLLSEPHQQQAHDLGYTTALRDTGIAGTNPEHPHALKCLHAHVAHQLATGQNPIGRFIMDHFFPAYAVQTT
ncbi:MAG: DUF501 domain-containing protein [Planctomycetota bacterium]